ncbi:hypothetical protein AAFF_G00239660 [Aldrovandia affinis]|uniref:Uncharacterized protein n=1 Tax=Aldrovandia affinis TaxID=143900 RepID=A0AAD7VX38_9TELE|nr:hypothetical protein AAFF_G00239660 [Aldrovandia affinis]
MSLSWSNVSVQMRTMFWIIQTRLLQLQKENAYFVDKVDDLENRSRSSNLRFIQVPESAEGRNVISFMSLLIQELLGETTFLSHRSLKGLTVALPPGETIDPSLGPS